MVTPTARTARSGDMRSPRPLESFDRRVLVEYTRRRSWFPSEMEQIERELGYAPLDPTMADPTAESGESRRRDRLSPISAVLPGGCR